MGCCPELRWEDRLRAFVVDCKGYFKDFKKWQSESMQLMPAETRNQRASAWNLSGAVLTGLATIIVEEIRWNESGRIVARCRGRKRSAMDRHELHRCRLPHQEDDARHIVTSVKSCGVTLRPTIECQVARAEEADAAGCDKPCNLLSMSEFFRLFLTMSISDLSLPGRITSADRGESF